MKKMFEILFLKIIISITYVDLSVSVQFFLILKKGINRIKIYILTAK